MQAGRVDVPNACRWCGSNLNSEAARFCSRHCQGQSFRLDYLRDAIAVGNLTDAFETAKWIVRWAKRNGFLAAYINAPTAPLEVQA